MDVKRHLYLRYWQGLTLPTAVSDVCVGMFGLVFVYGRTLMFGLVFVCGRTLMFGLVFVYGRTLMFGLVFVYGRTLMFA